MGLKGLSHRRLQNKDLNFKSKGVVLSLRKGKKDALKHPRGRVFKMHANL